MITTLALLLTINAYRASPLHHASGLDRVAQSRVEYLCTHPFSHSGFQTALDSTNFLYIGETLARGFTNAHDITEAMLNSPPHIAVMLDPRYKYFGAAEKCGVIAEEYGGYGKTR